MIDAATQPLLGRAAIVTGASRGLGREIARAYLEAGADVCICARDEILLRQTAQELESAFPARRIVWCTADVGLAADATRVVAQAVDAFSHLAILVNNAGGYGPIGPLDEVEWDAWVEAVKSNLFGSTQMIRAVLPHFKRRRYGKIIQISGGGAASPLPRFSAYAASKAGVVRLVETVAEEYKEYGIDANSIAPGPLNTRLLDQVIAAGPERAGADFHARALRQKEDGGTSLEVGAEAAVFLGSAASDGITGRLISALWDRWADWPQHLAELAASDLYTLRRITGRERGVMWGDK